MGKLSVLFLLVSSVLISGCADRQHHFNCKPSDLVRLVEGIEFLDLSAGKAIQSKRICTENGERETLRIDQPLDVVFYMDVSGSMGDEISELKEHVLEVADSFQSIATEIRFGLHTFSDSGEPGHNVRHQDLTDDYQAVRTSVGDLVATGGGDFPEGHSVGLMSILDGPENLRMNFNPEAVKIVILFTDAYWHRYRGTPTEVRAAYEARGIGVATVISCALGPEGSCDSRESGLRAMEDAIEFSQEETYRIRMNGRPYDENKTFGNVIEDLVRSAVENSLGDQQFELRAKSDDFGIFSHKVATEDVPAGQFCFDMQFDASRFEKSCALGDSLEVELLADGNLVETKSFEAHVGAVPARVEE